MPTKEKVIEELHYVTELLSTRARALAVGVLAISWVFLLANATDGDEKDVLSSLALLPPIGIALLSLLSDLGQYWCGYSATRRQLRRMQRDDLTDAPYSYKDPAYRLRLILFHAKLILALAAVLWVLALLLMGIFV